MNAFRPLIYAVIMISSIAALNSLQAENANSDSSAVQTVLTRDPVKSWIEEIDKAETSVRVAVYKISSEKAYLALVRAAKRGVAVNVITDSKAAESKKSTAKKLEAAGITVRYWPTESLGELHVKMSLVDNTTAITGSFNLSHGAEAENIEIFTLDRRPESVSQLDDVWQQLNRTLDESND